MLRIDMITIEHAWVGWAKRLYAAKSKNYLLSSYYEFYNSVISMLN